MLKKYNEFNNEQIIKYYKEMLLIRRFEEKTGQLYGMGQIGGFCHLYIGQEAIAVGMQSAVTPGDSIITSYRAHGLMLASGSHPNIVMAELLGRSTGCSKGKGGSMHIFDIKNNFFGGHGIVGAQVPLGTGIAFANSYKQNNNISFTYLGDGAVNQGQVYEAFNMASLWKLPVIYIIENNAYAMGTAVNRSTAMTDLYKKGSAFNIPGIQVDGMDLFEVIKAGKEAADYCRSGQGPIILEMKTYRYRGHSMSDPAQYRKKEELDDMKTNHDAIENLKKYMIKHKISSTEELLQYDKEIRKIVQEAVEFSQNSPQPEMQEIWQDVYKNTN